MNTSDLTALKQRLANAIRMLERERIVDYNGHFSVRVPDTEFFLINSGSSARNALTVDDIIMIDANGQLVEGKDIPPMEFHIHTEIYKRRKDVQAVVHAHPKWSTYFSMTGIELKPVYAQASLLGDIGLFPHMYSINTAERGGHLAEALAERKVTLLKSHGSVVATKTLEETFALCVYLEENAQKQYMALTLGNPYVLSEEEIREFALNLAKPHILHKVWDYHEAMLPSKE